jgi:hypothetical protein
LFQTACISITGRHISGAVIDARAAIDLGVVIARPARGAIALVAGSFVAFLFIVRRYPHLGGFHCLVLLDVLLPDEGVTYIVGVRKTGPVT